MAVLSDRAGYAPHPTSRARPKASEKLSDVTESTASLMLAQAITNPVREMDPLTEPTMKNNAGERRRPVMLKGCHSQTQTVTRNGRG